MEGSRSGATGAPDGASARPETGRRNGVPLRVIGAGFGRTGTTSLKAALETLGFGPCDHMQELFRDAEHADRWDAAVRGEAVDWEEVFAGYRSTLDWPGCAFYEELMARYPDAKVLLTVRDADRWYESAYITIYNTRRPSQTCSLCVRPMGGVTTTEKRGRGDPSRGCEPHRHGPEGAAHPPPSPSSHRQPCVAGLKSQSAP